MRNGSLYKVDKLRYLCLSRRQRPGTTGNVDGLLDKCISRANPQVNADDNHDEPDRESERCALDVAKPP